MRREAGWLWRAISAAAMLLAAVPAAAQKHGGVLTGPHQDTPPSASIHEEVTVSTVLPFMPVFNNLVLYDQHIARTSLETIRPELALSWTWGADGKTLTFALRDGVTWHDGRPFTAADVKCTFDAVSGLEPGKLRKSPRAPWYGNVEKITADTPLEVTFHLKRPQPSLIALLASGWSPIYPCHIPFAQMRTKPVGTGPFRFVEYRLNESMRIERNPNYWKKGLPYLDAIEWRIVPNRSTRMLGFLSGKFDVTFPTDVTVPLLKDIRAQAPAAGCTMRRSNVATNLMVNRDAPPFNNPELRRALALTLDRDAFNSILHEGQGRIAGPMLPPPDGVWGLPPEEAAKLYGYGPDVTARREEARAIMRTLGYGPENRLKIKLFTRDIPTFRDPALLLSDQLKEVYVDGDVEPVDTPVFFNRMFRKDYAVALYLTGTAVDDPDQQYFENYSCGSAGNLSGYCNPEMDRLFAAQSVETDFEKRRAMVWDIERKLTADVARPIITHNANAGCWHPYVKNITIMTNSIYNGWRWEDVWLDR